MEFLDKKEKQIIKDTEIDDSSLYKLEQQLKDSTKLEAEYITAFSKAEKKHEKLKLEIETFVAREVQRLKDEYYKKNKKEIASTAVSELRRSDVPLNKKYIALREKLIDAQVEHNFVENILKTIISKGYRVQKLIEIHERQLNEGNFVLDNEMKKAGKNLKQD